MEGIETAIFLKREKTFLAHCLLQGQEIIAYLPNPGRMMEILLPGVSVYLVQQTGGKTKRAYKMIAIIKAGHPILVDAVFTNQVVADLLRTKRLSGWEEMEIVKREFTVGHSRFDFLLKKGEERWLVEVKSCTYFGEQLAAFPDAVTTRGRKHLLELAELQKQGYRSAVLFMVHWGKSRYFLPAYHIDYEFAKTFWQVKDQIILQSFALDWQKDLCLPEKKISPLKIPWPLLQRELQDGGVYLISLYLEHDSNYQIGRLGDCYFSAGYYLYVGSAKLNLSKRIARHTRKRKKFHWHIDYLREQTVFCQAFAIRTIDRLEHDLAQTMSKIADWQIAGFGCSDCSCSSHLYGFQKNPIYHERFLELLQFYRMDRLAIHLEE